MNDKSGVIRYETLIYWYYTKKKEPWEGITELLMDKSKRVRLEASYILEKHKVLNVIEYYKNMLIENASAIAIYGIGEHGDKDDIELIKPYLGSSDDRLVKASLSAHICLIAEKGEEIYWTYLLDNRASIRKCAYLAIKKFQIHYGAKVLYNEFQKQEDEILKKYLVNLICTDRSTWGRLPYLLKLLSSNADSKDREHKLVTAINNRSMYAQVSSGEAQKIINLLNELSKFPAISALKDAIEYDLKFVTKQ